jgi:hypothetical protein
VAEVKASELDADFDSKTEPERGRRIIDVEPSATVATTKLQLGELDEPDEGEHLFHSQMWVKGTPCTSSLIEVAIRILSQQRSSSSRPCQQRHTHNPTPLYGFAKEAIFASTNSVDCRMTSSPSMTRYRVMLLLSEFVMFFWANLIYGNIMLYMSLGFVFFFAIHSQNKRKIIATSKVSAATYSHNRSK